MSHPFFNESLSRRRALVLGGSAAAGLFAANTSLFAAGTPALAGAYNPPSTSTSLPVDEMQEILESAGMVMNGVLSIEQDRNDLHVTGPHGIPFKPSWEINNQLYFQPLNNDRAIFNGDICVLPEESNRAIERIVNSKLLVQMAFHQHFFELRPMVFFMHFRGIGNPLDLAREVAYVVKATGTPLPQRMPSHPTTPLDAERLADILGGTAQVGGDGVVTVSVARKETIYLAGVALKPETGVSHSIAFEPLGGNDGDHDGDNTAVAPDFGLVSSEVNPVFRIMRAQGFQIHCLYNQETDESPQLFWSHQLAVGNAYDLARKIRNGLDLTH